LPQPPQPSATTNLIRQQPSTAISHQQKDYDSLKAQVMISIFLAMKHI
jgi:hypothetical protein